MIKAITDGDLAVVKALLGQDQGLAKCKNAVRP
jgi:hypothetical protein